MNLEDKLALAIDTLSEIGNNVCENPLFTINDSGKQIVLRCKDRLENYSKRVSPNPFPCISCKAREALEKLNK